MRRKDPAAVPQLDLFDFNSRTEGQFDFLSHAFPCTEGATLAISSTESDEDPIETEIDNCKDKISCRKSSAV